MRILTVIFIVCYWTSSLAQLNYCSFDGIDDYIQAPSGLFFQDSFTIEAIFTTREFQRFSRIVDFGNGPASDNVWLGYEWNSGRLVFEIWGLEGITKITSLQSVKLNSLCHVVATYENNRGKIYLNGKLIAEGYLPTPNSIVRQQNLIGKSNWPDDLHHFDLQRISIWSKCLSQSDINSLKNVALTGIEPGLILAYDFQSSTSTTVFDITPNAYHASLVNGASIVNCLIDSVRLHHELTHLTIDTIDFFESWERDILLFSHSTCIDSFSIPIYFLDVIISDSQKLGVTESMKFRALDVGQVDITVLWSGYFENFIAKIKAPISPPTSQTIEPYLSSPAPRSIYEIGVVILRFLPTKDGHVIDVSKSPDYWSLNPIPLIDLEVKIREYEVRTKFAIEEGSKFQGYRDPEAIPSIGYNVVEIINIYENTPPGKIHFNSEGQRVYYPDYHQIFKRFNLERFVNDQGVREIWIWDGGLDPNYPSYDPSIHDPDDWRGGNESNMSSSLSADISNSLGDPTDLPIYNHTYVVYGQNIRRTQAECIHVRGHQFERMLGFVNWLQDGNSDLFWQKFVGQDHNYHWTGGRCGWTHMPPNTTIDYDYLNEVLLPSDIEDWKPDSLGTTKPTNALTWAQIPYDWPEDLTGDFPQKTETQWYIYWMQNYPGFNNDIQYQDGHRMNNWWEIIANWDECILKGKGLYNSQCDIDLEIPDPATTAVYNKQGPLQFAGSTDTNSNVYFNSDIGINLEPGFTVSNNTIFQASIRDCGPTSSNTFLKILNTTFDIHGQFEIGNNQSSWPIHTKCYQFSNHK